MLVRHRDATTARMDVDGQGVTFVYCVDDLEQVHIATPSRIFAYVDAEAGRNLDGDMGGGRVLSPMHGKLLVVDVTQGARVTRGERVAVLEAMKMQHEIRAPIDGVVTDVVGQIGTQVAADDLLVHIEPNDEEEGTG